MGARGDPLGSVTVALKEPFMKAKNKQPREESVSKRPRDKKIEVEIVFGPPDEIEPTQSAAKEAGTAAISEKKDKDRRVIFRF